MRFPSGDVLTAAAAVISEQEDKERQLKFSRDKLEKLTQFLSFFYTLTILILVPLTRLTCRLDCEAL